MRKHVGMLLAELTGIGYTTCDFHSILLVVGVCWWHIIHHENMRCILRFKRSLGITSLQLRIFDFFLSFAKFLKAMGRKSWRLEVFSSQPVFFWQKHLAPSFVQMSKALVV